MRDMRCEACAYPIEGLPLIDYGKYVLCYPCDVHRSKLVELGIIPRSAWDDEDDDGFPAHGNRKPARMKPIDVSQPLTRLPSRSEFNAWMHALGLQLQRLHIQLHGVPHPKLPNEAPSA